MRLSPRLPVLSLVALLGSGCGLLIEPSIPYDPSPDAGAALDARTDDRIDAAADLPLVDTSPEVGFDAPVDAGTDAPEDAGMDVGMDVPRDVGMDIGFDVGTDIPRDVPPDVRDASTVDVMQCPPGRPILRGPWSGAMVRSARPRLRFEVGACGGVLQISRDRAFARIDQTLSLAPSATSATPAALTRGVPWFWRVHIPSVADPTLSTSAVNELRVVHDVLLPGARVEGVFGTLPDGDGDGIPDLVLGAPAQESPDGAGVATGHVYVLPGGSGLAGASLAAAQVLSPGSAGDPGSRATYGARITGGDVNGDGFPDLVVASRGPRVFVHFGSSSGFSPTPSTTVTIPQSAVLTLVPAVAGIGDFDRDGFCDMVAGVARLMGQRRGNLLRYRGAPTGLEFVAAETDSRDNVLLGFAVAPAGDVDSDGYGDFVVGNTGVTSEGATVGEVRVRPSSDGAYTLLQPTGVAFAPDFGRYVSAGGDIDGDGFGNVIVGQGTNPVLWTAGTSGSRALASPIDAANSTVGTLLTPVGDVNADGRDDLVRWMPGSSSAVVRGGLIPLIETPITDPAVTGATLVQVAGAGDLDNDGRDDVVTTWRRGVNAHFVVVFRVLPNGLLGADRANVLGSYSIVSEPRLGTAIGTAF